MALEERLNAASRKAGVDVMRYRRHVAFDRFLARLFRRPMPYLVAKGGYVMELRLAHARTTKDIDFSFSSQLLGGKNSDPVELQRFLQDAADIDMADFFEFVVGGSTLDLENAPYGGFRFPIEARMDGRRFVRFSVDFAAGDCWFQPHQTIETHNWLVFAGIAPVMVPVISFEQQFAEKLHSYTQPRERENSRVKDLVDMVLILREGAMSIDVLKEIALATFAKRKGSTWPPDFGQPPKAWASRFSTMAKACEITTSIESAVEEVRAFCRSAGIVQ